MVIKMGALGRIKEYLRVQKKKPLVISSAPGRVDFLNTHQDYKGLPVIPIAVDKRVYFVATRSIRDRFIVTSINLDRKGEFYLDDLVPRGRDFVDYLKACISVLVNTRLLRLDHGYEVVIGGDIPIGGGLGSSGALEVAFIKLLSYLYGLNIDQIDIAEYAFKAENEIMKIPCGRLDQYASAIGGTILLKPAYPPSIEKLNPPPLELVVIDSGVKHSTASIHPTRQSEINQAIRELKLMDIPDSLREKLGDSYDSAKWDELSEPELSKYISKISRKPADRLLFTVRMNELTKIAVKILKNESLGISDRKRLKDLGIASSDPQEALCSIVNKQHELLRDLYEVSTPEIERIRDTILERGAEAAKISGAGLGGCIIALVKRSRIKDVIDGAIEAGAKSAYHVKVDEGAKIEHMMSY